MIERGPLMPGTSSPSTNFSWDTRMWTAAAVVKPDTRVSDRYTTIKPTCKRPMASCEEDKNEKEPWKVFSKGSKWPVYLMVLRVPGKSPWGRSWRRPPGLSAGSRSGFQSLWCWPVAHRLGQGGSPQRPPLGSGLGTILRVCWGEGWGEKTLWGHNTSNLILWNW